MPDVYEPREDSYLMLQFIRKYANGTVLDMGTGSGILALTAAKLADYVIATDINLDAVAYAQSAAKRSQLNNVKIIYSDLFSSLNGTNWLFDLIIFNPPYLPEDVTEPEEIKLITTGGKKGWETLDRFFSQCSKFLKQNGKILICFSTLTNQDKVHEIIENHGFSFIKLAEQSFFAETIFVYLAEKNDFLKELELKGIYDVRKLTHGHRGMIYTADLDGKKVAIKKQRTDVPVMERITNEARWLKVLNRKGIGPKFTDSGKDYFIYEWVEGEFIIPWLKKSEKAAIKSVLTKIFNQCFELDSLHVNKEEMHNPYKHVLISNNYPVMIDFERAHSTEEPKNVTQLCQFVMSKKISAVLNDKGFSINSKSVILAAKKYKGNPSTATYTAILKLLK